MGFPVVTRLGLNQFWYKHWYSDTNANFTLNYKQDLIFIKLFKMYLHYGLTFTNTVFFHEIFLNKKYKSIRLNTLFKNLKYYRRFYFSNYNLSIEHSYFLRYRTGEFFPLRLWLIKYANWLILSFNCFKPIKKKSAAISYFQKDFQGIAAHLKTDLQVKKFLRFKLIFLYLKKFFIRNSYNYVF